MCVGTIPRTRALAMRQGLFLPGLARLDCSASRRSTVMRLGPSGHPANQSDSSSKRPTPSVASTLPRATIEEDP